jgi:hypothetical protein
VDDVDQVARPGVIAGHLDDQRPPGGVAEHP